MATKYITLSNLETFLGALKSNTKTVFGVNIWNNAITLGNGLAISNNTVSLTAATSSKLGGIQIGYTASGKNYPVQLSNNKAYVNVPWTDTNTDEMVKIKDTENVLYLVGYPSKGDENQHYMYTSKNSEVRFNNSGKLLANSTNAFIYQIKINGNIKTTTDGLVDLGTISSGSTSTVSSTIPVKLQDASESNGIVLTTPPGLTDGGSGLFSNEILRIKTGPNVTGIKISGLRQDGAFTSGQYMNTYYLQFDVNNDNFQVEYPVQFKWANGIPPFCSNGDIIDVTISRIQNSANDVTIIATWAKYY